MVSRSLVFVTVFVIIVLFLILFDSNSEPPRISRPNYYGFYDVISTKVPEAREVISGESLLKNVTMPNATDWFTPLQYIHRPKTFICDQMHLFMAVRTKADAFDYRDKWRRTFGTFAMQYNFAFAFFIGEPSKPETQKLIDQEFEKYGDVVQNKYKDSYRNITYKTLATYNYFASFCLNSTVLMRTDDDIYFNMEAMERIVKGFKGINHGYACQPIGGKGPIRNPKSKWVATVEEYPGDKYPTYCGGALFFLKHRTAVATLKVLPTTKFFWVDDVFVTGVLRDKANETLTNFAQFFDHPYIQSNEKETFRHFARKYPERMCKGKEAKSDCVDPKDVFS